MAITAKELREKQDALEKRMREHRDKITADDYKFDAGDEAAWRTMNTEHNERSAQIRQIEEADDLLKGQQERKEVREKLKSERSRKSHRGNNPTAPLTPQERDLAISGCVVRFLCGTIGIVGGVLGGEVRDAMAKAERQGLVKATRRGLDIRLRTTPTDLRTLQRNLAFGGGTGNAGVLGPDGFIASLEQNMLTHGPMLQVATIMRTDHGRPLPGPYVDDTGNEGDIVGEAASVAASQDPTLAELIWGAYKVRSKKIIFSSEAEEDSFFNLPSVLGGLCGERIGRGTNRYCTTGTGTGQHNGVVTGSGLGVTAASPTAFTADELINLEHSVDPAYRMSAAFMVHDTILAYIRKLKYSGSGEYIFDFGKGGKGTINGRSVQVNNHMASALTTGQRLVLFGDWSKYVVRQVNSVRLRRYLEIHADTDEEAVQAFLRSDGKIANHGTAPIKRLQLA
jgi:HK97 family phage major capsid protein